MSCWAVYLAATQLRGLRSGPDGPETQPSYGGISRREIVLRFGARGDFRPARRAARDIRRSSWGTSAVRADPGACRPRNLIQKHRTVPRRPYQPVTIPKPTDTRSAAELGEAVAAKLAPQSETGTAAQLGAGSLRCLSVEDFLPDCASVLPMIA